MNYHNLPEKLRLILCQKLVTVDLSTFSSINFARLERFLSIMLSDLSMDFEETCKMRYWKQAINHDSFNLWTCDTCLLRKRSSMNLVMSLSIMELVIQEMEICKCLNPHNNIIPTPAG